MRMIMSCTLGSLTVRIRTTHKTTLTPQQMLTSSSFLVPDVEPSEFGLCELCSAVESPACYKLYGLWCPVGSAVVAKAFTKRHRPYWSG